MKNRKYILTIITALFIWIFSDLWTYAQQQTSRQNRSLEEYIKMLENPDRAKYQKPEEVVTHLKLKKGETIADIGAGSGYFTVLFAREVGLEGKILAIDINKRLLDYIENRIKEGKFTNIKTILAKPHDSLLLPSSVDKVFICNTFHHIQDRTSYLKLLSKAFKPDGRLIIIDFYKRETPVGPPLRTRLTREQVIKEAQQAGYSIAEEHKFLPYQYFLVFKFVP